MRRRPWPIVILALLQIFVEPLTNVLLNSWLSEISPMAYLYWFAHHGDYLSLFYILAFPPIMGTAIYSMKKWSYPVFVCGSTWMLMQNLLNVQEGGMPLPVAAALYLGNLAFVGYFLIPAVKAPYMNPRMRWWETKPRYSVDFRARCEAEDRQFECRVVDFSEGGVFIETDHNLDLGKVIQIRFGADARLIAMRATPVFRRPAGNSPGGYGCQFTDFTSENKEQIRNLARDLEKSGAPVRGGQVSAWDDFSNWITTLFKTGQGLLPQTDQARAALQKQLPKNRKAS